MTIANLLKNQTALVTGANSGIGEGIARAMAAAGANVVINYIGNENAAFRLVREIEASKGTAAAIKADVSREDEVISMFAELRRAFGTLDILVSNAGLQRTHPLVDMTREQWQTVIDVNLTGSFCAPGRRQRNSSDAA
jgi:glucose 1-dehydrogenase